VTERLDLARLGAGLKWCPRCRQLLARAHFRPKRGYCRECDRAYNRDYNSRQRRREKPLAARISEALGAYGSIDHDLAAAHASEPYRLMMEACERAYQRHRRAGTDQCAAALPHPPVSV
jgi:hypothetical protein